MFHYAYLQLCRSKGIVTYSEWKHTPAVNFFIDFSEMGNLVADQMDCKGHGVQSLCNYHKDRCRAPWLQVTGYNAARWTLFLTWARDHPRKVDPISSGLLLGSTEWPVLPESFRSHPSEKKFVWPRRDLLTEQFHPSAAPFKTPSSSSSSRGLEKRQCRQRRHRNRRKMSKTKFSWPREKLNSLKTTWPFSPRWGKFAGRQN